jgi:hypothetical protein
MAIVYLNSHRLFLRRPPYTWLYIPGHNYKVAFLDRVPGQCGFMATVDRFTPKLVNSGYLRSFTSRNTSSNYYHSPSCIPPAYKYIRTLFTLSY